MDFSCVHVCKRRWKQKPHTSQLEAPPTDAAWGRTVLDLAGRGITLEELLNFYHGLGHEYMFHFDPSRHTTADVVRQAVVPETANTSFGPCALSTKLMRGKAALATRMVTHNWGNRFTDLMAAVLADALERSSYEGIGAWLEPSQRSKLLRVLHQKGLLQIVYWICAMCVNQHSAICGANPNGDIDPVSQEVHPICRCAHAKLWNNAPPLNSDGESIPCELNKFDCMMRMLHSLNPKFRQVIALDRTFTMLSRAWCVAEIYEAHSMRMSQVVKLHSKKSLDAHKQLLESLKVEEMQVSREEDKHMILAKIGDTETFDKQLRHMLLNSEDGILSTWSDALQSATLLGQLSGDG